MTPSKISADASLHVCTREPENGSLLDYKPLVVDERGSHFDQLGETSADATRLFTLWEHFLSGPRTDEVD
jgi:hypothetical protein